MTDAVWPVIAEIDGDKADDIPQPIAWNADAKPTLSPSKYQGIGANSHHFCKDSSDLIDDATADISKGIPESVHTIFTAFVVKMIPQ